MSKAKSSPTQFCSGSVTRIWAKNFLTFTEFEMHPEPNLNLIIGPNGTGKSSLVNALVLGLAGKTSVLGRASNIVDYIQYGKDKAELEIDLFNEKGPGWTIHRQIKRSGGSTWQINKKPATQKNVEEVMSELRIQVGNLCQCLPQDRVADFAKMTPTELFQNTQRAAGSEDLYGSHQELIEKRSHCEKLEKDLNAAKENVEQEMGHYNRIKELLKDNEKRQFHLDRVKLLKMKRHWVVYDLAKDQLYIKKQELEEKQKERGVLQKKSAPQEEAYKEAKIKMGLAEKELQGTEKVPDVGQQGQQMRSRIEILKDKIDNEKTYLQNLRLGESQRLQRIEALNLRIQTSEEELASCVQDDSIKETYKGLASKMTGLNQAILDLERKHMNLKASRESSYRKLEDYRNELRRLQDVKRQREEMLRGFNSDVFQALMWMRENQNQFKETVYEPIMLNINMADKSFASYVESHIPMKDLLAFAFKRKEDRETFMTEVRDKRNLKVSAVDVPSEPLEKFRPPFSIDSMRHFGFQRFLKDLFEAPDGVMQYLCKQYKVHCIPVGNEQTERNIKDVIKELRVTTFYTKNTKVSVRSSKYSNQHSSFSTFIRPARFLERSIDTVRQKQLMDEIQKLQAEVDEMDSSLTGTLVFLSHIILVCRLF